MKSKSVHRVLTAILVFAMVAAMLPVGVFAAEETATLWDFSAEDFTGENGNYNTLKWSNGYKDKVYLVAKAGTVSVPVSGPSTISVSACYQYSFYFESESEGSVGQKTGSTGQIDVFTYEYTGGAGYVDITVLGQSYLTKIEVTPLEKEPRLTDVWDFGAEQLDPSKYNNMLTVDEINGWYADTIEPGTMDSSYTLGDFATTDGQMAFVGGGKTNHRLRTTNTALTRRDEKSLVDADGNVYTGYIYSNSGGNAGVQIVISAKVGDIFTFVHGSNGGAADVVWEAPSGAKTETTFTPGKDSKHAQISTFYAAEDGEYKFYYTSEKLVVARIYRESAVAVPVTGTVNAPAELTGYSLVFTNTASGAVVEAPVENGSYTASLNDCYTYTVSLKNANGYVISGTSELTVEKNAAGATLDVTVVKADLVTVTGSITGISEDVLAKLQLSFQADAIFVPQITVSGNTYTAVLEKGVTYDVILSGINDYQIAGATTVCYEADATADIAIEAKPVYAVTIAPEGCELADLANATFTFTNMNEEGYVYTFVGTENIALRDGTYTVKVTGIGAFAQKLTSNVKVDGAAITKTIRFTDDITKWDFANPDFTGEGGMFQGLTWTDAYKENGKNHLVAKAGTVSVPVSGPCIVKVSAYYQYSFYFVSETEASVDQKTGSTGSVETFTFIYTGEAGTVDITVLGVSYLTKIEVVQPVAYRETITVGASGCDYTTVGAALAAVRAMDRPNNERVTILIQPGNYEEMLVIDVPNVTLKNASETPSIGLTNKGVDIEENAVRITWYYGCGYDYYSMGTDCKYDEELLQVNKENGYASFVNPGDGTTNGSYWNATVVVTTNGFQAEGIIFENSFNQYVSEKAAQDVIVPNAECKEGSVARADMEAGSTLVQDKAYVERAAALAIADNCKEVYFENCKFIGRQDTLYGGKGTTAAFNECAIYGGCDYIFGGMTAVFNACDLVFNTSENKNDVGYITAAQTPAGSRGFLFYSCRITSTTPGVDTASQFTSKPGYFGRPWAANSGEAVFYNTIIDAADANWADIGASLIRPVGWLDTLSGQSALCGEYGTVEKAEGVDNSGSRASWATMFETEVLGDGTPITIAAFLGDWDPFPCKHANTEEKNAKDAKCEETGYTGDTYCTDCGELVKAGEEIAAPGHNYVDGECTVCGNPETGDVFGIMVALMAASGTALVVLKKKED